MPFQYSISILLNNSISLMIFLRYSNSYISCTKLQLITAKEMLITPKSDKINSCICIFGFYFLICTIYWLYPFYFSESLFTVLREGKMKLDFSYAIIVFFKQQSVDFFGICEVMLFSCQLKPNCNREKTKVFLYAFFLETKKNKSKSFNYLSKE